MLLSLLSSCGLFAPEPDPFTLSVALPAAQHAGSIPARSVLWPLPQADDSKQTTDAELQALCAWWKGEAEDDRIAEALMARGNLGFSIIEADATGVWVSGQRVLSLQEGRIPESERRGVMISRLYDVLLEHIEGEKEVLSACGLLSENLWEHSDALTLMIAVDPTVSFETVLQIVYTAGQAQVGRFYIVVDGPLGDALPESRSAVDGAQVTVIFQEDQSLRYARSARPDTELQSGPLTAALPTLLGEDPLGCGLVVPRGDSRWSQVLEVFDGLGAAGARHHILAAGGDEMVGAAASPATTPASLALTLQTMVPAFLIELPTISAADPHGDPHGGSECDMVMQLDRVLSIPDSGILDALGGGGTLDGVFGGGELGALGGLIGAEDTTIDNEQPGSGSASLVSATVTLGEDIIDGPLRPELLNAVIRRRTAELRYCYQRELNKEPTLSGGLTMRFVIDADGTVASAEATDVTMSDAVVTCVTGRFMRMKFPQTPGALTTTVTVPMTFTAQ